MEATDVDYREVNDDQKRRDMAFKAMLTDDFASAALKGLLSSGSTVSFDTAHLAYKMSQMMIEVRSQYVDSY